MGMGGMISGLKLRRLDKKTSDSNSQSGKASEGSKYFPNNNGLNSDPSPKILCTIGLPGAKNLLNMSSLNGTLHLCGV
uniref:Uncharacterized protein n=1 Tax=Salix viminalis TaxID=40686 RepID=A0A6N2MP61_SALVM